jgi:ferredoxin
MAIEAEHLVFEAREVLRGHFLSADMGVTGANFLIAETGSVALVTNEGNEGMCTIMPPKVHVALTGVEKVLPTLEDLATLMRLLPRSATGQPISNYFSVLTGPRRPGELDGPEHMYYVLVDAGRTGLLGSEFQEMLRCIRCGACMNHCPVYQKIGGHAYGWVYPGPMGSVLTPSYVGVENALDLPHAATLCGQCAVVCPVRIPLPDLLRKLREKQWERGLRPWYEPVAMSLWGYAARRPSLYALRRTHRRARTQLGGRQRGAHSSLADRQRLDAVARFPGTQRSHLSRHVSRTARCPTTPLAVGVDPAIHRAVSVVGRCIERDMAGAPCERFGERPGAVERPHIAKYGHMRHERLAVVADGQFVERGACRSRRSVSAAHRPCHQATQHASGGTSRSGRSTTRTAAAAACERLARPPRPALRPVLR